MLQNVCDRRPTSSHNLEHPPKNHEHPPKIINILQKSQTSSKQIRLTGEGATMFTEQKVNNQTQKQYFLLFATNVHKNQISEKTRNNHRNAKNWKSRRFNPNCENSRKFWILNLHEISKFQKSKSFQIQLNTEKPFEIWKLYVKIQNFMENLNNSKFGIVQKVNKITLQNTL